MAKIKTLYQNGQQIMPVTHPKAVMDDDGETLEAKLSKINKRLEACGNGGSMSGQLVGSASGTSVSVSDALAAPFVGLRVCGKSTQDGTPMPTEPVPIVSAGDGGTTTLKVTGKNLFHATLTGEFDSDGINMTVKTSTIAIKGTATKDVLFTRWLVDRNNPIPLDPNKRYTISPKSGGTMVCSYDEEGIATYNGSKIPERSTGIAVYFQRELKKDETVDLEVSIQVELGTETTEYEPYREQLLVLQTPNGLPGIPVTSGGNYTDESGQQWVCDEVDLARGVRVQRITKIKLTSSMSWNVANSKLVDRYYAAFKGISMVGMFCTHFSLSTNFEVVGGMTVNLGNIGFAYAEKGTTTVSDFKAFLDANEVYVWAVLASPVETALSAAEIAAYKSLTTYAPTTVISVSDGAGATVTYQRDAILVIKRLEEAIASTAAVSSLSM